MKNWIIAAVGCGLGVVGCFGQVSDGTGGSGSPSPAPSATTPAPPPSSPLGVSPPSMPAPPPQSDTADAGDGGTTSSTCVSDSGTVCNLPDGTACAGDQECASGVCFANGSANGGVCSEFCTAANQATVCNFGQHACSDAVDGICLP